MISYSDYVLSEKPWAYWPLNDVSISGITHENQLLLDVTGNERHLTATQSDKIVFKSSFTQNALVPQFPSDSLPVQGIKVNADTNNYSLSSSFQEGSYVFLSTSTNAHINDVELEMIYNVSHQLFRRRVRGEFLLDFPIAPASPDSACSYITRYPILTIGGMTLWMNTIYYKMCKNCNCQMGASFLTWSYQTLEVVYQLDGRIYTSRYNQVVFWTSGYLIGAEGGIVSTAPGNSFPVYEANGTGMITHGRRMIAECHYLSDKHMKFLIIIDNGSKPNQLIETDIVLLDRVIEGGYSIDKKFQYNILWTNVGLLSTPTVSNLSVYYDQLLDVEQYVPKSWNAVKTHYVPQLCEDLIELSDNVKTNINLGVIPNSFQAQLDSMLIRGISHKRFSSIETEDMDNGNCRIILWLGTYDNTDIVTNQIIQDYKIGDVISLDGVAQNGLNGCWKVEELLQNGIVFTTDTHFESEDGYFIAKRAPVGGGAWSRTANMVYSSLETTLDSKLSVSDASKIVTTVSTKDQSVIWKKMMKRDSTHYLGGDLDYGTAHWTIIGDHLRFYLTIAYKQNPKPHSHILIFGDLKDERDDQLKTVLEGYIDTNLGDVGFNKVFEYPRFSISENGEIVLQLIKSQPSGIGWIISNKDGEVDYLHGIKDCGEHYYPALIPST